MKNDAEMYELLFGDEYKTGEPARKVLRHKSVSNYRVKVIKSGPVLECEIYPIWNNKSEERAARKRIRETRAAQKALNERNARKKIIRLINANFTEADLAITLTYRGPAPDERQARRDMQNYMRRVKDYRRRVGLPPLKYIYVVEFSAGTGGTRKRRVHHHVIMSGMDRDTAERLWGKGFANTRRLQPDQEYEFEALGRYIVKEPMGSKRWCASRNLRQPVITTSDRKLSKRQAERIADDADEAPDIFEKTFKGYNFVQCDVKRSEYVAGAYMYVRMHRDKPPAARKPKKG